MAEETKQNKQPATPNADPPTGKTGGYASTVLTIISVVCAVATPVLSAWAAPKAVKAAQDYENDLFEEYIANRNEHPDEEFVPLTWWERTKCGIKYYLPAVGTGVLGIVCNILAHAKDQNTITQVVNYANAVSAGATIFEKVTQEKVSAQKYDEIRAETAKRLPEQTVSTKANKNIMATKDMVDNLDEESRSGRCWMKDPISGQLWWGSITQLDAAINEVNNDLQQSDGWCTHAQYMLYAQSKGIKGVTVEPIFYDTIYIYRNSGDILRRYVDMAKFDEERGIAYLDLDYNMKPEIRQPKKL